MNEKKITTVDEILLAFIDLSPEEQERVRRGVEMLQIGPDHDDWEPNEEQVAEIRRRLAEVDAGAKTYSWEEVRAELQLITGRDRPSVATPDASEGE